MSKKLLMTIAAAAIFIWIVWPDSTGNDVWVANKLSAGYPDGVINEPAKEPNRQLVYIDVTGSMTPYYLKDKRTSVVNAMSAVFTLIHRDSTRVRFLGGNKVYLGYANDILQQAYDIKDCNDVILRRKLLRVTNFDIMFGMAVDSINKSPGTIVYLLTDGIQSLNKRDYSMGEYLNELRGSIKNSLSKADDVACAIYRYLGDFNGTYINCREESKNVLHLQRPFYIVALGNKQQIRWLAKHDDDKMGNPQGSLFIGTHDFEGHKKAVLSSSDSTHLRHLQFPGEEVTLILNLPSCMANEVDPSRCNITGVANPAIVSKQKTPDGLKFILPTECGILPVSEFVSICVSMPNEITGDWFDAWSNDDDTSGPDSVTTFGLSSLVRGIVDGLQPDSVFFETTFKYIP